MNLMPCINKAYDNDDDDEEEEEEEEEDDDDDDRIIHTHFHLTHVTVCTHS